MDLHNFNRVVTDQLNAIHDILVSKGAEYVPDGSQSRFHNFDVGAALNGQTNTEVLWGYLTKHLVSLADMVKGDSTQHDMDKWSEKIGDAITYLVLLKAMVRDNDKDDALEALREKLAGPQNYINPSPSGDIKTDQNPPPAGSAQIVHHTSENREPTPNHIVVGLETDAQKQHRESVNAAIPNRSTH